MGCIGAAANGGIQPCFAILFSEIINVFSLPDLDQQRRQISLFAGLFVAMGAVTFIANILQVRSIKAEFSL